MGAVAGTGEADTGVPHRIDGPETVDQRDRPCPRPLVDRGVHTELGEIEPGRLQRERNVDGGVALVNRNPDIDAGRHARAEPRNAAPGLTMVTGEIALGAIGGRDSVELPPHSKGRRIGGFRGAASARIPAQPAAEAVARLLSKALQEITAEVGHRRAGRHLGIDLQGKGRRSGHHNGSHNRYDKGWRRWWRGRRPLGLSGR